MAPARIRLLAFLVFLILVILQSATNVYSRITDLQDAGRSVEPWRIAVDEASSAVAWFICLAVIWKLVRIIRPPRVSWPFAVILHLLATVPISLMHVGLMVAFREAAHAIYGSAYQFSTDWPASLLYEYRKDVLTYILLAAFSAAVQWFTRPIAAPDQPVARIVEVTDGAVTHRVAAEDIDWVESAGNYVTLHLGSRELLHRTTLAALEASLGQNFLRIHRSRLVRREPIASVETHQSGDFTVTLTDGTELRGSRRFRSNIG